MRHSVLLATLLLSSSALADGIDLGQASGYNAFVKNNFSVNSSDTEGKIAIGGDFIINGGYDLGTKINDFGMGDGPSLVVGGDIIKSGTGNLNIYRSATLPDPILGDAVVGGTVIGDPIDANTITNNADALPVDFTSAFEHLSALSDQLANRTATPAINAGWKLDFIPSNATSDDNVFVFNVDETLFQNQYGGNRTDWHLDVSAMQPNSTVVFNILDSDKDGQIDFTQANVFLNNSSNPLSDYFKKGLPNDKPPVQVLYNFYGANKLNITSDLYGSILAPKANIFSDSMVYGQVIGNEWTGNGQINYNPFVPVDPPVTAVSEPGILAMLLSALLVMVYRRRSRSNLKRKAPLNTCNVVIA
ncbi:collagen-binding domain-containing protein [Thalassotalea fusca]